MRQFNTPPGWPDPPTARWRPPKRWRPPESWPAAPAKWAFWVDEAGAPVRGPIGRYGGPSRIKLGAIAAVPLALIAMVLFNPFDGDDSASTTPVRNSEPTSAPTSRPVTEPTATATMTESPEAGRTPTSTPSEGQTPSATPETTQERTPEPTGPSPTVSRTAPTPTTARATTTAVVYQTCADVRAAGKAPLHRGDPGYSEALDRNGDGVACERGNS